MARPRKSAAPSPSLPPNLAAWAETVGEAIARGVARVLEPMLAQQRSGNGNGTGAAAPARRRGRPLKAASTAAGGRACSVEGCTNPVRSKGMCSAHYQAARRRNLQAGQQA